MFLVVSVSMLNKLRLGVLGVAKITNECVCLCACCVCCVAYMPIRVCVSVFSCNIRVVFAYNYYLLFFTRNLLLGHITKPYLAPVTQ